MFHKTDGPHADNHGHPAKEPAPEHPAPDTADRTIDYDHNLAHYGYNAMDAMLNDWWRV